MMGPPDAPGCSILNRCSNLFGDHARLAHDHNIPLIVENIMATPILLRPIEFGGDIVVHSLTKFLGGHGTTIGGAIVDSGNFPWDRHTERFPMFSEPDRYSRIHEAVWDGGIFGPLPHRPSTRLRGYPFANNAFLPLRGIETIGLRIVENADIQRRKMSKDSFLSTSLRFNNIFFPGAGKKARKDRNVIIRRSPRKDFGELQAD